MTSLLSDIAVAEDGRLYLRPVCPVPTPARPAARIGGAGPGFDAAEVIVRDGTRVARATAALGDVFTWARGQGTEVRNRVAALFERITGPRAPFAGLALDAPRVMGIVNVTPDSFSDGGDHADADAAVAHGLALAEAGAEILDIGGESTRPGSDLVAEEDECARVLPVVAGLRAARPGAVLSLDSRKPAVMERAAAAGADILNDVSALTFAPDSLARAAALGRPAVLMHCLGDPKTMQDAPAYGHAPGEIFDYLEARVAACEAAGIARSALAVDPGIGFGKTPDHNFEILRDLAMFHGLGCALLIGVSRKRFIGAATDTADPRARLPGSLAAMLWAVGQGAQIVRVHDVIETVQALAVWRACAAGAAPGA